MCVSFTRLPVAFETMRWAYDVRLGSLRLQVARVIREEDERHVWIERVAGARRGRVGPLLFVADARETKSKNCPSGPLGENRG
jgi:hypothetical protein